MKPPEVAQVATYTVTGGSPGLARYGLEWVRAGKRRIVKHKTRANQCRIDLCISSRAVFTPNTFIGFDSEIKQYPLRACQQPRGLCLQTRIDGTKNDCGPRNLLYLARMRFSVPES